MRLCRWVVPVRGSPQMMIGAAICSSRISGCRRTRSSMSSRFFSRPRMRTCCCMTPGAVEAALSVPWPGTAPRAVRRSRPGPKSCSPVSARAAAMSADGLEGQLGSRLLHEVEDGADLVAEAGLAPGRRCGRRAGRALIRCPPGRTSTWGCSGVAVGQEPAEPDAARSVARPWRPSWGGPGAGRTPR